MMEWINSEQGVTVLRAAVLIMVLVWLLSNGFGFLDRWFPGNKKKKNQRRDKD